MMYAREKSDSAIVAGKPTNKVERSAAEPAEPRAEAKGNANQHSTHRTQSRASVTQALERVRKAASKRKKEKFTALLHHISIDLLGEAFFELKKDAAPGVDGLTWRTYEADLDRNLKGSRARLRCISCVILHRSASFVLDLIRTSVRDRKRGIGALSMD